MRPTVLTEERLPLGVMDLPDPPRRLFSWGRLPPRPWVAVVGTRRASAAALEYTRKLCRELSRAGVTVVSGGAEGIDAAAHEGALEVNAPTVVVAPSSFERPYPSVHGELFRRVIDGGGAVLSEHEQGVPAKRHVFFARNAIMVACSAAVVLVEAPFRSGARNATQWARRLARPVFVVPHPPWHTAGRGCITELVLGGQPLASHRDVLTVLGNAGHPLVRAGGGRRGSVQAELWPKAGSAAPGSGALAVPGVLGLVPHEGFVSLEWLCDATGLEVAVLQQQLTPLVLGGSVEAGPLGYRRRR